MFKTAAVRALFALAAILPLSGCLPTVAGLAANVLVSAITGSPSSGPSSSGLKKMPETDMKNALSQLDDRVLESCRARLPKVTDGQEVLGDPVVPHCRQQAVCLPGGSVPVEMTVCDLPPQNKSPGQLRGFRTPKVSDDGTPEDWSW